MATLFGLYPFLITLYADHGYAGPRFQAALRRVIRQVNLEIVRRSDAKGFVILPKRWIVERTIAWLNRCRRLALQLRFLGLIPIWMTDGSCRIEWRFDGDGAGPMGVVFG